ncbi:HD domain-containing protein [Methanosarcina vacuolata]|uniref:Putative dNTP triphosphohydrolase, Archaeal subgroup n=1 Tax=Methanosarcina vacuolata Z-761 TaxID=1434123 RepID=A0A0E3Q4P0_9EURY|nr:HD domain-containing protein [Methanosarcina vacuolata]AKB43528.1 Putative dNTP triphosphohydrolase, Archaeal subgroup [Methanosarcina vacuolata Z-761]
MLKYIHELRDPIHNFIHYSTEERKAIDSRPIQRLRYIHQLALTYLVYPGATHKRFEHSLGVMELASRVYDVVTDPNNILDDSIRTIVPKSAFEQQYWRRALRMAALFHDAGHLPFSHAAEKELLPEGWNHERITVEIIRSEEMKKIWNDLKIQTEDVVKLAVGKRHCKDYDFTAWEAILSEIIVGDALGVDRMDYLLRDSCHTGVAYGKFDHYRLIETMRILPNNYNDGSKEPALGIEDGGLHAVEAMLLARYFMYTQLYLHPVRRIYDIHLREFLKTWLQNGVFPIEIEKHLQMTDNEVFVELFKATRDQNHRGHEHAERIVNRNHFKLLDSRNPEDISKNPEAPKAIFNGLCNVFGKKNVSYDTYKQGGGYFDFPVYVKNNRRTVSARYISNVLSKIPIAIDFIYINPDCRSTATKWLNDNREHIIKPSAEE